MHFTCIVGFQSVGLENLLGVLMRDEVKAEGWNAGLSDNEGRIWTSQGLHACGNPIPISGISHQIIWKLDHSRWNELLVVYYISPYTIFAAGKPRCPIYTMKLGDQYIFGIVYSMRRFSKNRFWFRAACVQNEAKLCTTLIVTLFHCVDAVSQC